MLEDYKILVVDDSPELRKSITAVLRYHNADVREASNGNDGLAMALQERPDVIITDLMMQHHSGIWLIEALRAHESTSSLPVMAMSADIISLMNCPPGCIRVSKPFKVDRFISVLAQTLAEHAPTNRQARAQ